MLENVASPESTAEDSIGVRQLRVLWTAYVISSLGSAVSTDPFRDHRSRDRLDRQNRTRETVDTANQGFQIKGLSGDFAIRSP